MKLLTGRVAAKALNLDEVSRKVFQSPQCMCMTLVVRCGVSCSGATKVCESLPLSGD